MKQGLLIALCVALVGCSSVTSKTSDQISAKQELIAGQDCVQAKASSDVYDQIKWGRGVLSPAVSVASIAMAPLVLGLNAVLDYADRANASSVKEACHLPPISQEQMLVDVATNSTISLAIGSIDLGLGADVSEVQKSITSYSSD